MPTDSKKEHSCHVVPFHAHHQRTHHLQDYLNGISGSSGILVEGVDDDDEEDDPEDVGDDDADNAGDTDTDSPARPAPLDLTGRRSNSPSSSGIHRPVPTSPVKHHQAAANTSNNATTANLSPSRSAVPTSPGGRLQAALNSGSNFNQNPPGTANPPSTALAHRANSIIAKLLVPNSSQSVGRMIFAPRCPISTVCAWATGPPLDVLRKVTDITKLNKNKNMLNNRLLAMSAVEQQSRKRRWWIILSDLKLYFFEQYGDPKPKIIADILNISLSPRKIDNNCLTFVFPDQRIWQFEFAMLNEATSFEFAVLETQRCINDGGSQFLRLADVLMGRSRQVHGVLTVS
jgi:hypothetical protein